MSLQGQEPNEVMRTEIRLAGHKSRLVGWVIACSCFLAGLTGLLAIALPTSGLEFVSVLASGLCLTGVLSVCGLLFASKARKDYASRRTEEFRRTLRQLPPDRQASVLLPLRDDPSRDVRAIVRPLIEQLKVAREVTPASAPDGRGDEPSGE